MIRAFEVYYQHRSFIFGDFKYINIDPELVLFKSLVPFEGIDEKSVHFPRKITLRIGKKKRTFRGFFIAEDEYALERCLIRNRIMKSREIREVVESSWLFSYDNPYFVEWRGKTYAFSKEHMCGILSGWERRDGCVYPVVAGWFEKRRGNYFYLHRIDATKRIAHFRFLSTPQNIPKTVIRPLSDGFIFNTISYDEEQTSIIPFAPYDVKYALRIYPPTKVIRAKEEPLPKIFNEPFIIKRFLVIPEGIKVIETSPGVVRAFVHNINGNIYMPSCPNPHWDSDYENFWRGSAGYILLCKPERFLG